MRTGRVTRLAEFGAFVELEPGVEGLAHASTFAPTGRSKGWSSQVAVGMTGAFEILSIDLEKKRIGVALRAGGLGARRRSGAARSEIVPGARLTGKVERHEKFGVFVFLAPGTHRPHPDERDRRRQGSGRRPRPFPSAPTSRSSCSRSSPPGRRIRLSVKAIQDAHEAEEVREYTEREDAAPAEGFGSLADKLRGALKPREK